MAQDIVNSPIVKIKQGSLRGSVNQNIDGGEYISFKGVPYAEPPLGELRFKVFNKKFSYSIKIKIFFKFYLRPCNPYPILTLPAHFFG